MFNYCFKMCLPIYCVYSLFDCIWLSALIRIINNIHFYVWAYIYIHFGLLIINLFCILDTFFLTPIFQKKNFLSFEICNIYNSKKIE